MGWKGNAELLKSSRVGWEKSVQSVEAHMAANVFIDNGPGSSGREAKRLTD